MTIIMLKIARRKHKLSVLLVAVVALIGFSGCHDDLPKEIIQPSDMENILYDYHLAYTMSSTKSDYREEYHKQALREYVFKKHQITSAMFDSSMVWYTRHSTRLSEIYDNLAKRFGKEFKHVSSLLGDANGKPKTTAAGDTVDIWNKQTLCWLTGSELNNKLHFTFPTDSNFVAKDSFAWNFDAILLSDSVKATMAMNVLFANDSVIGKSKQITSTGNYSLGLKSDSTYAIKQVSGYVYLESHKDSLGLLLNKVSLTRYHDKNPADSISISQLSAPVGSGATNSEKEKPIFERRKIEKQPNAKKLDASGLQQIQM